MAKINLVPDVKLDKLKTKRRNFIVTVVAIVFLGVMIIFILILQGYRWSRVYSLDQTKKKIASTKDELKSYKDIEDMVTNIENGTKAVNEIERKEPKWSRFLPVLQQVTPNDIRFSEFEIRDNNQIHAKVQGRDIGSIGRLIKSLERYEHKADPNDKKGKILFKNVDVKGYTTNDTSQLIEFDIDFEMEQGVLW